MVACMKKTYDNQNHDWAEVRVRGQILPSSGCCNARPDPIAFMKTPIKIFALMGVLTIAPCLSTTMAVAYEEREAGKAVIEGIITFKGTPPDPRLFDLAKFPNSKFCAQADSDGKGHRIVQQVNVKNEALADVVVYIQDITMGKPFKFNGTDVKINLCRLLVQGGPSTMVGIVVKGAEIRILNDDADPNDPKAVTGVLHNPHAYEILGGSSSTIFNLPLPDKGQVIKKPVILRKKGSTMKLQTDQQNFMEAYFYPVENPYYAIVGSTGAYEIDRVPPGKYTIIAWHPILGTQEKEIEVGAAGAVTVNFEFSKQ
jgi:hypothetical protein